MQNEKNELLGLDEVEMENTPIDEMESEVVNLIFVGIDQSYSMSPFTQDMVQALTDFKSAISDSKEVDEILVARANFYQNTTEISGYKTIDDFDVTFTADGMTPLYDVIKEGTEKLNAYMTHLKENGMRVKAVFAIFSDGEDTSSTHAKASDAKRCIDSLNQLEITTAFISFGNEAKKEAAHLGFRNTLEVGSSASELRKGFSVLSKSVIESSKSVTSDNDNFFDL